MNKLYGGYVPNNFNFKCNDLTNIKTLLTNFNKSVDIKKYYYKHREQLKIIKNNINPFTNLDEPYSLYYKANEYYFLLYNQENSTNNYLINNNYETVKIEEEINPQFIINNDIKEFLIKNNVDNNHQLSKNSLIDILYCNKYLLDNKKIIYNLYLYSKFYINDIINQKMYKFLNELFLLIGTEMMPKRYLTNILNLYIYSGHIHFIKDIINNRQRPNMITKIIMKLKQIYYIKKEKEKIKQEKYKQEQEIKSKIIKETKECEKLSPKVNLLHKIKVKTEIKADIKAQVKDKEYIVKINFNEYVNDLDYLQNNDSKKDKNIINKLLINKYIEIFTNKDNDKLLIQDFLDSVKIVIDDNISELNKDIIIETHYLLLTIMNNFLCLFNEYVETLNNPNNCSGFDLVYSYNYYNLIFTFEELKNKIETNNFIKSDILKINNIINRTLQNYKNLIIIETSYLLSLIYEIDKTLNKNNEDALINNIINIYITSVINKGNELIPININYILYEKQKFEFISDYFYKINNNNTYLQQHDNSNNFFNSIKANKVYFAYGNYLLNTDNIFYSNKPKSRPDCGESLIFNLINYLIYDEKNSLLNNEWLPENTIQSIKDFYLKYNSYSIINEQKPFSEFDTLLQNIEFTYQSLDTYIQSKTVYSNINIKNLITHDDIETAFNYKVYDDEGHPIKEIIKYTGWEIRPGYINIIRILNYIFGYGNINNKYNEEKVMNNITSESLREILSTFKNPLINEILIDYKINPNDVDFFSDIPIRITINSDINMTLTYKHAETSIRNTADQDQKIIIDKYNINNILYASYLPDSPFKYICKLLINEEISSLFNYSDLQKHLQKKIYPYKNLINIINYIYREEKLNILQIDDKCIDFYEIIKNNCNFDIKNIIDVKIFYMKQKIKTQSLVLKTTTKSFKLFDIDDIDILYHTYKDKSHLFIPNVIYCDEINSIKFILNYANELCIINNSIDTTGDKIINHIINSKNIELITYFIEKTDVNLLYQRKYGDNIFHTIKFVDKYYKHYKHFEKIINLIQTKNPNVFNQMIIQKNKKMKYPYITSIINNKLSFSNLLPNNDIILCEIIIQYLRLYITDISYYNLNIIIELYTKIVDTKIKDKISIYSLNLIIKFIDNQRKKNLFYNIFFILKNKNILNIDYYNFLNEYFIDTNNDKINRLINDIFIVNSPINDSILKLILNFDSINLWENYTDTENLNNIFSFVVENRNTDLTSILVRIGQARNPKLIGDLKRLKLIEIYFDFLCSHKDIDGNTIFHHFAIGNIKISNPVEFKSYNPDDFCLIESDKIMQNFGNLQYKYKDFFDILFDKNIELFKLKNNSEWRIIDILSVIPQYPNFESIEEIKSFKLDSKKYNKIIYNKINNIIDIILMYYKQINKINEDDKILLLFYHKTTKLNSIIKYREYMNLVSKLINKNSESSINFTNFINTDLYKYIPHYLLKEQQNIELYTGFNEFMMYSHQKDIEKISKPQIYLNINQIGKLYPKDFNIWFYKDDKIFIEKLKSDECQNKYFKYKKKYLNLKY